MKEVKIFILTMWRDDTNSKISELELLLNNGWQIKHSNSVIVSSHQPYCGPIVYILEK